MKNLNEALASAYTGVTNLEPPISQQEVNEVMYILDTREVSVLSALLVDELTLTATGKKFNVSRNRIAQLRDIAFSRIRRKVSVLRNPSLATMYDIQDYNKRYAAEIASGQKREYFAGKKMAARTCLINFLDGKDRPEEVGSKEIDTAIFSVFAYTCEEASDLASNLKPAQNNSVSGYWVPRKILIFILQAIKRGVYIWKE